MSIVKLYESEDVDLNIQLLHIQSAAYANKRIQRDVIFSGASDIQTVYIGDRYSYWTIVNNDSNISVKKVSGDNINLYLQASGAGSVTVEVW